MLSAQLLSYTAEPLKGVMSLYAESTQEMAFSGPTWIIESHVGCQVQLKFPFGSQLTNNNTETSY